MENIADWRTESRTAYSNDFKLRIVELASHPDANVAKIARENGVAHNLIFKWLRMWQNEGRENDPQVPRQLRQYYRQWWTIRPVYHWKIKRLTMIAPVCEISVFSLVYPFGGLKRRREPRVTFLGFQCVVKKSRTCWATVEHGEVNSSEQSVHRRKVLWMTSISQSTRWKHIFGTMLTCCSALRMYAWRTVDVGAYYVKEKISLTTRHLAKCGQESCHLSGVYIAPW